MFAKELPKAKDKMEKNKVSVKTKWFNMKLALAKYNRDYCDNTKIHALKYITNNRLLSRESIYESSCVNRVQQQSMLTKNGNDCPEICIPSCYDLTYLPDFFTTPITHSGFQISNQAIKNISSSYVEKNIAVVNVYFKESWYRSNKQSEYIGMTDFLSSIGGIIGLFFGFSFISLAEITFYIVLKPVRMIIATAWTKRKIRRNQKRLQNLKLLKNMRTDNLGLMQQREVLFGNYEANITKPRKDIFVVSNKKISPIWRPGMEYTP